MFLIIRVTVRSCIPAGQRSLRLPQLCGEDGFSTRPADGRHSGAVSPVYTKISKILVIVHNVRGIWTIGVAGDGDGRPLKVLLYLFGEQTLLSGQISFCQGRKRFLHCDLLTFVGPTTEISD